MENFDCIISSMGGVASTSIMQSVDFACKCKINKNRFPSGTDPYKHAMKPQKEFSQAQIDRIVEMAWEDRTPFEAIEYQFGIKEAQKNMIWFSILLVFVNVIFLYLGEQENVIIRFEFSGDRGGYLYIDNVRLMGEWIGINEDLNTNDDKTVVKKIDFLGFSF